MRLGTAEVLLRAVTDRFNRDIRASEGVVREFGRHTTASLAKVTAGFASLAGVGVSFGSIVGTTREFQKLEASLKTSTGSAESAKQAFEALKDFAKETPYSLQETTKAFTQLVNLGLTPSEQALRSYGNTSAALNKDITQMVEAVADAVTGEFERLKEFGIKASKQGDEVKFTFRGVTTTVKNNAAEIEKYLIRLGETNFGDAMANRMDSLDGAISNFGDSWEQLAASIGDAGVGEAVEGIVVSVTGELDEIRAWFESGSVQSHLEILTKGFEGFETDVSASLQLLDASFDTTYIGAWSRDIISRILPDTRAAIAIFTVEVAASFDKLKAYFSNYFKILGEYRSGFVNPAVLMQAAVKMSEGVDQSVLDSIDKAKNLQIDEIINQRDKDVDDVNRLSKEADQKLAELKAKREADKKSRESGGQSDRLAQYKYNAGSDAGTAPDAKAQEKAAKKSAAEAKKAAREREQAEKEAQRAAEQAARDIENSYSTAYSTIGVVNQTIYDQILARYQRDRDDFIKATGDKKTAELIFQQEKKELDKKFAEDSVSPEKKALKEKLNAYADYYSKTGVMTQGAYDSYIAQYGKDRDDFIKATNDKVAAWEAFYERVRNLNPYVGSDIKKIEVQPEQWTDGIKKGLDDFQMYAGTTADLVSHTVQDAFGGMEDALVGFVSTGKMEFSDLANSIIADLARIAIRQSITQPLMDGAKAVKWGEIGTTLAGFFHSGGEVSRSGAVQAFPASWFAGAPRFHEGVNLKNDEIPAILQTGERVLSRKQNASYEKAVMGGGTVVQPVVNITVKEAPGTKATVEQSTAPDGSLNLNVIIEQVENSISRRISRGAGMATFLDARYHRKYS